MKKLVERIRIQQQKMGYTAYCEKSKSHRLDYLRDISLALMVELVEFLQEVPWKPWKAVNEQHENIENAGKEWCDILVFLIVLMLTFKPDFDYEGAMTGTLDKIDRRIANNYGINKKEK